MSAGNAAARQRRAGGAQIEAPVKQSPVQASASAGLTLPQVIQLVDARLIKLETFVKAQNDKPVATEGSNLSKIFVTKVFVNNGTIKKTMDIANNG